MKKLLHLVGCLHRCTTDARSHKHQVQISYMFGITLFQAPTSFWCATTSRQYLNWCADMNEINEFLNLLKFYSQDYISVCVFLHNNIPVRFEISNPCNYEYSLFFLVVSLMMTVYWLYMVSDKQCFLFRLIILYFWTNSSVVVLVDESLYWLSYPDSN